MIGFYISVNIGYAIGWGAPFETSRHNGAWSKVFSSIHVTIGQIFVGIAVLYIAEQLMAAKESWMIQILQKKNPQSVSQSWIVKLLKKLIKLKILILLLFWICIGLIFSTTAIEEWNVAEGSDFVLSVLSKSGYRKLPDHSAQWKFLFVGFYALIGIPLTIISLGMVVSYTLAGSEERTLFENIMVAVTPQELEVMRSVGIGVGDNVIQKQDFIVLMVVRIGAAPPAVITKINERFKTLDRKKQGKISYDDIVFRGKDITYSRSETLRKIFARRTSKQTAVTPVGRRSTMLGPAIRNTFFRATKRVSTIFPTMDFRHLSAHQSVDIDEKYQPKESDEDEEEDEENEENASELSPSHIVSPSARRSQSMSQFQLSLSHSFGKITAETGELTPSNEMKDSEVLAFDYLGEKSRTPQEDGTSLHDLEASDHQSEPLDGIEEFHDEDEKQQSSSSSSSSSSDSDSDNKNEAAILPDLPSHDNPSDTEEARDEFSSDIPAHYRQRRKPVRISRALRHQLEIKKEKELLSSMNLHDGNLFLQIKEYLVLRLRHSHFLFVVAW
jgi:hypothetical protein